MTIVIRIEKYRDLLCKKKMRAKTIIDLLSLSTSLYMLSKDEELMKSLSGMKQKGKEKVDELFNDEDGVGLTGKIMNKAKQAKEELEQHIEETVKRMYEKMQIAHLEKVEKLQSQIDTLKKELAISEARLVNLESQRK